MNLTLLFLLTLRDCASAPRPPLRSIGFHTSQWYPPGSLRGSNHQCWHWWSLVLAVGKAWYMTYRICCYFTPRFGVRQVRWVLPGKCWDHVHALACINTTRTCLCRILFNSLSSVMVIISSVLYSDVWSKEVFVAAFHKARRYQATEPDRNRALYTPCAGPLFFISVGSRADGPPGPVPSF